MILNEINKVKKILGSRNVSRFYLLVPLDIICSLLEIISISVIIPFVIAISDKQRILSSDYSFLIFDYLAIIINLFFWYFLNYNFIYLK